MDSTPAHFSAELYMTYGWWLAFIICGVTVSWAVLVFQAIFTDHKIAMLAMASAFLAGLGKVFGLPALGLFAPLSPVFYYLAVAGNIIFVGWFTFKYFKTPVVYICAGAFLASVTAGSIWYFSLPSVS